ncbi:WXG100 family type VII secretion target [Spirillospora sp. NPDC048911]|uniref:WXG100 family type VII secretion target n=1 Tax=Spirillospora sp. NPDC048911 TaxID=3364527 RepID=UPI003714FC45
MAEDYSPEIHQALDIIRKVPGGAAWTAEYLISQLWGDVGHIENRAKFWKELSVAASIQVVSKLGDESKAIDGDHWSGKAKTAYTDWISELSEQSKRIQDSFWQIGTQLEQAKQVVESMRSDLRAMALWLIGAVGGTFVAVKGSTEGGLAIVALAVWEFVQELNDYYSSGDEKFSELTTSLRDLRLLSKDLVSYERGVAPGLPIPVQIPQYAPELPFEATGDWRNWGKVDPKSRK